MIQAAKNGPISDLPGRDSTGHLRHRGTNPKKNRNLRRPLPTLDADAFPKFWDFLKIKHILGYLFITNSKRIWKHCGSRNVQKCRAIKVIIMVSCWHPPSTDSIHSETLHHQSWIRLHSDTLHQLDSGSFRHPPSTRFGCILSPSISLTRDHSGTLHQLDSDTLHQLGSDSFWHPPPTWIGFILTLHQLDSGPLWHPPSTWIGFILTLHQLDSDPCWDPPSTSKNEFGCAVGA